MTQAAFDLHTPLRVRPLKYLLDGEDVVVGRTDVDSYGVFPPDGAALLRRLAAGDTPAEAAAWYGREYGEQLDMDDFVAVLAELDFLGGPAEEAPAAAEPVRWQRLGRAVFSRPAWIGYGLLTAAAITACIATPGLAPRTSHLFYTRYVTLVAATVFLGQVPFVLLHEAFHALAGRRLGVRSSLRISRRLHFLVFETNLDGLVVVPRRQRYLPMTAGLLADVLVASAMTLVAALLRRPDGTLPLVGGLCLAVAFSALMRFAWQFYFYLRTDVYGVLVTAFGCNDLRAASRRVLANRVRRVLRRPALDESGLHPRDREVAGWYSWLMLAGYALSLTLLALVILPASYRSVHTALVRLVHAGHAWHEIADSLLFLVLLLGQFAVVGALAVRDRVRRRRAGAVVSHLAS